MPSETRRSVNAGELSDNMDGRDDLSKFRMGCEILENARVLRVGGGTRRAGMKYVGGVIDNSYPSRLKGFRFDDGQGVVLEFSHLKMRVLEAGAIVATEYVTPWTEDHIFKLNFAQRIDRIVVTNANVSVHNIVRFSDGTWAVEEHPWQERVWEPYPDAGDINLIPGAVTGTTTITASDDLFTHSGFSGLDVGDRIKIDYTIGESTEEYRFLTLNPNRLYFDAIGTNYSVGDFIFYDIIDRFYWVAVKDYDFATDYVVGEDTPDYYADNGGFFAREALVVPETDVQAGWVFETFDTWDGTMLIQRSYDGGATWATIKTITSNNNRNERVEETETAPAKIRVVITETFDDPRVEFTQRSFSDSGSAVIDSITSRTVANVTVEDDFPSTNPSSLWFECAFSPRNGYPAACVFYQGRLCLAGTTTRPQTLWLSRSKRPFDFTVGTLATDGLSLTTDANEYESIVWLASHLSLLVGTTTGVWAVSSPDGSAVSPESNRINRQMQVGAEPGFQPQMVQNNVLFLQFRGRKVQELTGGSVEYGGYLSADLTQLADHITRGGVTQIDSADLPDSQLLLAVGGEVAILTYEREQNVVGWARWKTMGGTIESVSTTSGGGEDDDYYFVVTRGGNSYIEYLAPDMLRKEEDGEFNDFRFLDCYSERTDVTPFNTMNGLERFNGRDVTVVVDGKPRGTATVLGGSVTLPVSGNTAYVGIPYDTEMRPTIITFGLVGSKSSASSLHLRVLNSLGGQVSQNREDWADISDLVYDISGDLELVTNDIHTTPPSTWSRKTSISIRQSDPLPLTVLAMRVETKTSK